MTAAPVNLYDLTRPELSALLESAGVSPAHTARVWRYLYWECVETIAAMAEVPKPLKAADVKALNWFDDKLLMAAVDKPATDFAVSEPISLVSSAAAKTEPSRPAN